MRREREQQLHGLTNGKYINSLDNGTQWVFRQSPAVDKLGEVTDTLDDTWYPDELEYWASRNSMKCNEVELEVLQVGSTKLLCEVVSLS